MNPYETWPGSHSQTLPWKQVHVEAIDGAYALVRDEFGKVFTIPAKTVRTNGALPRAGQSWIVDQSLGVWTFSARIDAKAPALSEFAPPEGHLSFGGHRGTLLAAPVDPTDAATKASSEAAATAAAAAAAANAVAGVMDGNARLKVRRNSGADAGTRRRLNLIEGANIALTVTDDAPNEEIDVTIASTVSVTFASPTQIDVGDTVDAGTGTDVARAAHQHAFPAPAGAPPTISATTSTKGVATTPALSDHTHGHAVFSTGDLHTEYLNNARHDVIARHPIANLDTDVLEYIGVGGPDIIGSSGQNTRRKVQSGQSVVTTNGAGGFQIVLPDPFPNGVSTVIFTIGNNSPSNLATLQCIDANHSTSDIEGQARDFAGATLGDTSIVVNWLVIGF